MVIQCPKCKKQYNVEGSKVTEQGVKITCPSCANQFVVKRRPDEKKAAEVPKKPKTPPCMICGQPSTHVLMGKPPRPLCEYHHKVEREKETRFFDSDPGLIDRGGQTSPAPDPGKTRIDVGPAPGPADHRRAQPDPGITQPPMVSDQGPAPAPGHMPSSVSEPAFESFDDEFGFFDEAKPASESPPKAEAPKQESEDEMELASPSDFMMPGSIPENAPAGPEPAASAYSADEQEGAPVISDPFQPAESDHPDAVPADHLSADAMGDTSSEAEHDPFQPEAQAPPPEPEQPPRRQKEAALNLDGSPVDDRYAEFEEHEEDFAWEDSSSGPAKTSLTFLDDEVAGSVAAAAEVARQKKAAEETLQTYKESKPRSMFTAVSVMLLVAAAVVCSAYVSFSGALAHPSDSQVRADLSVPSWQGQLSTSEVEETPSAPLNLPALVTKGGQGPEDNLAADDMAKSALNLIYLDTPAGYDKALDHLNQAIRLDPENHVLYALKTDLLAFQDSRTGGKTILRSDESKKFLSSLDNKVQDSSQMMRAKAHVFLNDNKTAFAKALLNNYLEENQKDAMALYLMGLTYRYQPGPDLKEAVHYLEWSVKVEPRMVQAYWDLAEIYREMGRYEDAMDMYNQVLTRSPDRKGTAEAMEETSREKAQAKPGRQKSGPGDEPVIVIPVNPTPRVEGIEATGSEISDAILDVINEVEPQIRKINLAPQMQPTGPIQRTLPRPPEEAPP